MEIRFRWGTGYFDDDQSLRALDHVRFFHRWKTVEVRFRWGVAVLAADRAGRSRCRCQVLSIDGKLWRCGFVGVSRRLMITSPAGSMPLSVFSIDGNSRGSTAPTRLFPSCQITTRSAGPSADCRAAVNARLGRRRMTPEQRWRLSPVDPAVPPPKQRPAKTTMVATDATLAQARSSPPPRPAPTAPCPRCAVRTTLPQIPLCTPLLPQPRSWGFLRGRFCARVKPDRSCSQKQTGRRKALC